MLELLLLWVYEFPVESIVVNDEVVEEYADIQSLQASVVVNENVYSVFNNSNTSVNFYRKIKS